MERQRFGKVSIRAVLWRTVIFCTAVYFTINADAGSGNMLAFLFIWFFRGIGIALFVLLGIFSRLATILETDGTFLYVVEIYYFKTLTFPTIKIADITKMVFVGNKTVSVIIQYGDKQYCLKVKKGDKTYKYLLGLANMKGINQQDDKIIEKIKRDQTTCRIGKILLFVLAAILLWFYRSDITFYIMVLGMLITPH